VFALARVLGGEVMTFSQWHLTICSFYVMTSNLLLPETPFIGSYYIPLYTVFCNIGNKLSCQWRIVYIWFFIYVLYNW